MTEIPFFNFPLKHSKVASLGVEVTNMKPSGLNRLKYNLNNISLPNSPTPENKSPLDRFVFNYSDEALKNQKFRPRAQSTLTISRGKDSRKINSLDITSICSISWTPSFIVLIYYCQLPIW